MSVYLPYGEPTTADQSDGPQYTLGQPWSSTAAGAISGNRWRAPTNAPVAQCRMCLFRVSDQVKVAESNPFTAVPGVDNDVLFTSPFSASASVEYMSGVVTDRYAFRNPPGYPHAATPLTTTDTGRFKETTGGTSVFPDGVSASAYMISPIFDFAMATVDWTPVTITLSGVSYTVTPGMITIPWTPIELELEPQPFDSITPGMVTIPWTPVELHLQPQAWGFDGGPGVLTPGGRKLSALTPGGRP